MLLRFFTSVLLISLARDGFATGPVEFNRDIRPLLNTQCFQCHGGVKEAGELNLQFRDKALQAGESGLVAIVPGKPEESELIARLTAEDKLDRMPRKADPLKPEQIALLKRWVAEGAHWQDHWAYETPRSTGRGIDAVVHDRLKAEGLAPAPEADRWILGRRAALDITGLPPSLQALEAFVRDPAPDAYERWVDGLLAAPAYGERWAVPWLDLARYADSKGYESDRFRDVWRYRDWVIDALNADKPYNEFVIEQLAGDLLPDPQPEHIIATAFHRNTPQNDEGGTDDEEFRTYAVLDRLNTTFDALQGTSIGCVQCHGHPYDPFLHREYYELLAFFNNTADADRDDQAPTRKFRARADQPVAEALEREVAALEQRVATEKAREQNHAAWQAWLSSMQRGIAQPLGEVRAESTKGDFRVDKQGVVKSQAPHPDRASIDVHGRPASDRIVSFALEMLPDAKLPGKGSGVSPGPGNFILTRVHVALVLADDVPPIPLQIAGAKATFEQDGWPLAEALRAGPGPKNEGEGGWAIGGGTQERQLATFTLAEPLEIPPGATLRVTLECENGRWLQHVLGSFRITTRSGEERKADLTGLPEELQKLLARDAASWKPEEKATAERHFLAARSPEMAESFRQLDGLRTRLETIPLCVLPVMQELEGAKARKTHIFDRGNWMEKGEVVQPGTPKILNPWRDEYPRNRLGLARWMTNGENPLTARVQVNRVWEQIFGVGLVETLEDFGSQGDKPVYQEILDNLAVRFQTEMKWSQKALIREIMLSQVYRQSSIVDKALVERDPANRLLARGARFRLSSEQLRDQALLAAGILSQKMFGPPVMPYQPPGTWLVPYEGRDWNVSPDEDSRRRGLYTFIRRSAAYPSGITFDAPNREYCLVRRTRTNTPLQSLDLMNSPVFMEAAAGLSRRMTENAALDLNGQLARGLYLATLRPPRPEQVAVLRKLHERVAGNMTLVANAILNLDEVLNKN